MKLNKEQYQVLQVYEQYLDTAVHFNYVRTLPHSYATDMAQVYTQLTKQKPNISCPKCVLNMCNTLGILYFNYKNTITQDEQI